METFLEKTKKNVNVQVLKSEIKVLNERQKICRNQRKIIHIVGERTITAGEAQLEHISNGMKLRIMYAVYGLLRGKSFSFVENTYSEEEHPLKNYQYEIDKLMEKYKMKE